MTGICRRLTLLITVVVMLACSVAADAYAQSATPPAVLLLHSANDNFPWQRNFRKGFFDVVDEHGGGLEIYEERLDHTRFSAVEHHQTFLRYLQDKYGALALDLIVSNDFPAANFLAANEGLFEGVRRLIIDPPVDHSPAWYRPGVTIVPLFETGESIADLAVEQMRDMVPDRDIYIVGETISEFRLNIFQRLERLLEGPEVENVTWLLNMRMPDLLARVEAVPADAAIFYALVFKDGSGQDFIPAEVLRQIVERSRAPVFVYHDTLLGTGAVGGYVSSGEAVGRSAAVESLAQVGVIGAVTEKFKATEYLFDQSALERFGIELSALPPDARLINQPHSLWRDYRIEVLFGLVVIAVLAVFGVAISIVLVRLGASRRALRASQQHLASAQSLTHVGSSSWEIGTDYLTWSEETFHIFGLPSQGEWIDLTQCAGMLHPEDRELVLESLGASVQDGRSVDLEYRIVRSDGTVRLVHQIGHVVHGENGSRRVEGAILDITESRAMQQRAMQSERLQAVWHLAGGMAHHFNNLFAAVLGNAELLQASVKSESQRRFARTLITQIEVGAELNRKLLSFSRQRLLSIKVVDAAAIVRAAGDRVRAMLPPKIKLEMHIPDGLWPIQVDTGELEFAIEGLVSNAREAMEREAQTECGCSAAVALSIRNVTLDEAFVQSHEGALAGDYVCISVADTGPGMSDEVLAQAFDPFFTTKPVGQGTGMGLSTIYGFVKQLNGYIELDSRRGEGARVNLYFSRAEQAA